LNPTQAAGGLTGKEEGIDTSQAQEANSPLYFPKLDFSGAKAAYGTATLIPTASAVPSVTCQSVRQLEILWCLGRQL